MAGNDETPIAFTQEERVALAACLSYLLEEDHDSPYDDWLEGHIGGGDGGRDETLRPTLESALAKLTSATKVIFTGSNDGSVRPVPHKTLAEAEAWIAERQKIDPEGVARGDYYIDAPERKER